MHGWSIKERMIKKRIAPLVLGLWALLFLFTFPAIAEDDPEDGKSTNDSGPLTFEGFLEMENLFNAHKDQSFDDAVIKNEIRGKFKIRYGTDNAHVFLSPDLYLSSAVFQSESDKTCAYNDDFDVARNMRISDRGYEASLSEGYVHYGNSRARVRVGNQIYGWGTADVFNPTSYFNPYDMRETFFKDDDELKLGVPSISGMAFFEKFTVEMVIVPVHIPGILAEDGRYWEIHLDNYQLPIVFDDVHALSGGIENSAFGARVSSTILGTDVSVSAYHGPDKDFVYLPSRILVEPGEPVSVLVTPKTYPVSFLGMDFSKSLDSFVFQAELAYSPDKRTTLAQNPDSGEPIVFPYTVERSDYIAYAVGFNYFIPMHEWIEGHEGDTVLTMEWYQTRFLNRSRTEPVITDFISARFEDSYFKGRVPVACTCLVSLKNPGYVIWPRIGYDFQNGFSTTLSYLHLDGRSEALNTTESLFYYFRNNDSLIWKLHYDF
jgi:hypothetical protein